MLSLHESYIDNNNYEPSKNIIGILYKGEFYGININMLLYS